MWNTSVHRTAYFGKSILAVGLVSAFSLVSGGVGENVCPEGKGPCCDLDWTGQGATIVKIIGDVLVSNSPYVAASIGMRVRNGGRVMTLDASTAIVAYDDGCWHVLKENQVLTIEDVSPCCAAAAPPPPPPPVAAPKIPWAVPAAIAAGAILWPILDDDDDGGNGRQPISR
jgi:hypothetical protein